MNGEVGDTSDDTTGTIIMLLVSESIVWNVVEQSVCTENDSDFDVHSDEEAMAIVSMTSGVLAV